MKHNKKRNTAFIYEALARDLTKSILEKNNDRKQKIIAILKEFFSKGQPLAKEIESYNILLRTKNINEKLAERILNEAKNACFKLDESELFDAKSRIISSINKQLGQEVWSTFIPNFKALASIDAVLNSRTSIKKKVLFEQAAIDRMCEGGTESTEEMKPIDNLTYSSFIKKFNEKYDGLLQEQKELLNRYITSFADEGFEFRVHLNEELARIKSALNENSDTPELIAEKLSEVLNYLEELRRRELNDTDLHKILKTQELVQEFAKE